MSRQVYFSLEGILFQYDEEKNHANIIKHGISFTIAARVFLDQNRIEMYDDEHSHDEDRYNTIGDVTTYVVTEDAGSSVGMGADIIFVVYTERSSRQENGKTVEVIRIISARQATNFERGLYYGKFD